MDAVQVELYPQAPAVTGLVIREKPLAAAEEVRTHPNSKPNRVVTEGRGFRFQSMRSSWRRPNKHVTVFREPGVHAAFADVVLAGPKHLIAVWRNGSHTGGSHGLSLAHSRDRGRTWEKPILLTGDNTANCPRIQRLKDGSLLVLSDFGRDLDRVEFWRSTDAGKTWNSLNRFEHKKVGSDSQCYVPGRILEMNDGSWFLGTCGYAWVPGLREGIRGDTECVDFYRSTDRGRTWSYVSGPFGSPPRSLNEPSTMEIAPGHLVVYARDSNGARPGSRGESRDAGKTWTWRDLPFPIVGRPCAGFLSDGRVMNTFRSAVGRGSLWAWVGDVDDATGPQPVGAHFNDRRSVGLRDGALHIDSDGARGQFTKYFWPSLESPESTLDLTFEVKVLSNPGRAASVVVPFAGVLRLFPDHVVMAHDPLLRADVKPGVFHTYRIQSRRGSMKLLIDGRLVWETKKGQVSLKKISHWLPLVVPGHVLAFGNEVADSTNLLYVKPTDLVPEVSGYSIWRSFKAITDDPHEKIDRRVTSWKAGDDRFPDQYQLDHIVEVDASANGYEQGYSGWVQLADGSIFLVNYTDDSSAVQKGRGSGYGIPWIRGTFLSPEDLPRVGAER